MKTAELEGVELDRWVAKVEWMLTKQSHEDFAPSTNWAHGGPLIDREMIAVFYVTGMPRGQGWCAGYDLKPGMRPGGVSGISLAHMNRGPTALVAAMRAFVSGKLGENLPDR